MLNKIKNENVIRKAFTRLKNNEFAKKELSRTIDAIYKANVCTFKNKGVFKD
jgi:hypothetical protein